MRAPVYVQHVQHVQTLSGLRPDVHICTPLRGARGAACLLLTGCFLSGPNNEDLHLYDISLLFIVESFAGEVCMQEPWSELRYVRAIMLFLVHLSPSTAAGLIQGARVFVTADLPEYSADGLGFDILLLCVHA